MNEDEVHTFASDNNLKLIDMKTLKETLSNFWKSYNEKPLSEEQLQPVFKDLAEKIIFGGYINVNNQYHIFINTVEFYFHQEKEDGIKDYIVYHRNMRLSLPGFDNLPYFPLMHIHAHNSGYDITFEDAPSQTRASVLIRAYSIFDCQKKKFIVVNDTRSTFLYYYLNGFNLDEYCKNNVFWHDKKRDGHLTEAKKRKNVDDRKWSFSSSKEYLAQ